MEMLKQEGKKRKRIEGWIILFIEIIVHGIYLKTSTISNYDEFTSIAAIEILAGKDWREIAVLSDFHGYGFLLPLIPIVKFINDGVVLYKVFMIWMLLLRIVMAELIYYIANSFWNIKNRSAMWIAIICSFGTLAAEHQSPISVLTEGPLCLACLGILYFVSKAEMQKRISYLLIGAFISAFAITIHARSLFIQFSFVVLLFLVCSLNFRQKKKWSIVSLLCTMGMLLLSCLIVKKLNGEFNSYMYSGIELSNSYDTVVSTRSSYLLYVLTNINELKVALKILFAQMMSYVYYSGGVIGIVIALIIIFIFGLRKKGFVYTEDKLLFYSGTFGLVSWLAMNIAMAFTSVAAVNKFGNLSWYTYIRYTLPFATIMVMTALAICCKYTINFKRVVLGVALFEIIMCKIFLKSIVKELDMTGYGMKNTMFNSFLYLKDGETANNYFGRFTFIIIILFLLYYVGVSIKPKYVWGVYLTFSLVVYCNVFNYIVDRDKNNVTLTNATKEYCNDESGEIYVLSDNIKYLEWLQVALPNYKLRYIDDLHSKRGEKIDVFTDSLPEGIEYEYEQLDDNEWIIHLR